MTEDEARKMWCPFVRVADSLDATPPAANCTAGPDADRTPDWASCVGSLCMAWRLKEPLTVHEIEYYGGKAQGYCGLAGKIERVGVNG
jgi:hypothetical protein